MKTKNYIIYLLFFISTPVFGQNNNIFQSYGYYTSIGVSSPKHSDILSEYLEFVSFDFGIYYRFRYNLKTFDEHKSFSVEAMPHAGWDYGNLNRISGSNSTSVLILSEGYGGIGIPIIVAINLGAGATYDTDKNKGFALGLGADLSWSPLFSSLSFDKFSAQPMVQLSYRYWKARTNGLGEFYVRLTFGGKNVENSISDLPWPGTILIGWGRFIGY